MKGAVISDLHLFSGRCRPIEELHRLIDHQLDCLVLNGDIFDFKWNQHQDRQDGFQEASNILRQLCEKFPHLRIIYLSGNHDQEAHFDPFLNQLSSYFSTFSWRSSFFQIGTKLFHHGDLFFKNQKERPMIKPFQTKSARLYSAYKKITDAHINRLAELPLRPSFVCPYIEKHWQEDFDQRGVTDIYFGHTHVPFENFQVKQRRYHNSGTFIKNQQYKFIQFTTGENDAEF